MADFFEPGTVTVGIFQALLHILVDLALGKHLLAGIAEIFYRAVFLQVKISGA